MSNLHDSYIKILSLLHEIEDSDCYLNQIRQPALSDKELIALCLASESLGIDSERYLFKQLPSGVIGRVERSVYNKRRRRLGGKIEWFRQQMVRQLASSYERHLVDSMPLEICKLSRAKRSRTCSENTESSPDYGYCAAQNMHYFGYKIHAVCTEGGVFKTFDISKASVHDIHYLNDIKRHLDNCILIGDKGYLSRQFQDDLFEESCIDLKTPMRNNQIDFKPFPKEFRKARKRIETLFSQLCDQFMIRRNYAKSFTGFATRILSKLTALTVIQWINKRSGRNINNLKIVVA